jgi:ABC-type multidrug transport system permease subunit
LNGTLFLLAWVFDFQSTIINHRSTMTTPLPARSDAPFYVLAALAGMGTGWADVVINDLLFTALLVLMACMLLGVLRPRWPWRWVIVVGMFIPLTELAAYLIVSVKPTRAQVYGSFLASLPGIAGAYGGSLMRGVVDNLRQGK